MERHHDDDRGVRAEDDADQRQSEEKEEEVEDERRHAHDVDIDGAELRQKRDAAQADGGDDHGDGERQREGHERDDDVHEARG